MANIYHESHFCVDNAEDGYGYYGKHNKDSYVFELNDRVGFGLIQWTDKSRKELLYNMAKEMNGSVWDLEVQLACFTNEMKKSPYYSNLWKQFLQIDNMEEAVKFFLYKIEGGDPNSLSIRLKVANDIMINIKNETY